MSRVAEVAIAVVAFGVYSAPIAAHYSGSKGAIFRTEMTNKVTDSVCIILETFVPLGQALVLSYGPMPY